MEAEVEDGNLGSSWSTPGFDGPESGYYVYPRCNLHKLLGYRQTQILASIASRKQRAKCTATAVKGTKQLFKPPLP